MSSHYPNTPNKMVVIHNFPTWLPITQNWMYNQVYFLPKTIEPHVVCETTQNLDHYAVPNLHCLSSKGHLKYLQYKLIKKIKRQRQVRYLHEKIIETKCQILHSHFGVTGWRNIPFVRQTRTKHVVTFYGQDVNRYPFVQPIWRERYKELFDHTDLFLCEGPHMAQCLVDLGCPSHKIKVHRLGVEVDNIEFRPRMWDPAEALKFLIAASFQEKKGIPYALEALGKLQDDVPLEITIIGDANQEKRGQLEKKKILEVIKKYHLHKKIRMLGFQPHTALFSESYKHHIFLSPSIVASDHDTEGGAPVSIIEMVATGMPVVSTLHCDIPSIIQHGETGFLAKERDVAGLIENIKRLITLSTLGKWEDIAQKARLHVERNFNARIQGKQLAEIYFSLYNSQTKEKRNRV